MGRFAFRCFISSLFSSLFLLSFPGELLAQNEIYVPHVVAGAGVEILPTIMVGALPDGRNFSTDVVLFNLSATTTAEVAIETFSSTGEEGFFRLLDFRTTDTGVEVGPVISVEPLEALQFSLDVAENSEGTASLAEGWGRITTLVGEVKTQALLELKLPGQNESKFGEYSSKKIQSFTMLETQSVAGEMKVGLNSIVLCGGRIPRESGIAFVNPSSHTSSLVELQIREQSGTLEIPPLNRVSLLLRELPLHFFPEVWIPECPRDFFGGFGILSISANSPIAINSLTVAWPEGKFTSLPVWLPE